MSQTEIFFWTDRIGHAYCDLRLRGGHWHLEWGYRDPPGSDNYLQRGERETSNQENAVAWTLERVRAMSDEPDEGPRVEEKLRESLRVMEA
jgi:hypothetical protein